MLSHDGKFVAPFPHVVGGGGAAVTVTQACGLCRPNPSIDPPRTV